VELHREEDILREIWKLTPSPNAALMSSKLLCFVSGKKNTHNHRAAVGTMNTRKNFHCKKLKLVMLSCRGNLELSGFRDFRNSISVLRVGSVN
jgi:hypothetical protein